MIVDDSTKIFRLQLVSGEIFHRWDGFLWTGTINLMRKSQNHLWRIIIFSRHKPGTWYDWHFSTGVFLTVFNKANDTESYNDSYFTNNQRKLQ